ncbi:MAG: hypothetical protein AB7H80_17265, partial [Candidatus Kapaibacterium sp.]
MDKLLHRVRGLVERGERISAKDCRRLFDLNNLNDFSQLGRIVRERKYGRDAFFRAAERVEYRGEHPELFLSEVETLAPEGAVEFLVKVAWREGESLDSWRERFRLFAASSLPITLSLSATFLTKAVEGSAITVSSLLKELADHLPIILSADDALLFDEEWRAKHQAGEISGERWLAVHSEAHELGLKTDGGMTFHTPWNPDLYVSHLDTLRSLQDKTEGFRTFAPMAWHDSDPDARYLATPTASTFLKVVTISRLFLDNIPHIVVPPGMSDPELSYVALSYGADTIDSTLRPADLLPMEKPTTITSGGELQVLSDGERREE